MPLERARAFVLVQSFKNPYRFRRLVESVGLLGDLGISQTCVVKAAR